MKNKPKIDTLNINQNSKRDLVSAWGAFVSEKCTKPIPLELNHALHDHLVELQDAFPCMRNGANEKEVEERNQDLRNIALEMLDRRLLRNNNPLNAATTENEIYNQLDRSCRAAIDYAGKELRRNAVKAQRRRELLQHHTQVRVVSGDQITNLELKLEDCMYALEIARTEGSVSNGSAEIFLQIVRDGLRQTDVARQKGVSRAAICQRMKLVQKKLIRIARRHSL